jgi:hypothetical protein
MRNRVADLLDYKNDSSFYQFITDFFQVLHVNVILCANVECNKFADLGRD